MAAEPVKEVMQLAKQKSLFARVRDAAAAKRDAVVAKIDAVFPMRPVNAKQLPGFWTEMLVLFREAVKDVRATFHQCMWGSPEHHGESGAPMNPTQVMVTTALQGGNKNVMHTVAQEMGKEEDMAKQKGPEIGPPKVSMEEMRQQAAQAKEAEKEQAKERDGKEPEVERE